MTEKKQMTIFELFNYLYEKKYNAKIYEETWRILLDNHYFIMRKPLYQKILKEDGLIKKIHVILVWNNRTIRVTIKDDDKIEVEDA